jgi:hypothetical protein
MTDWLFALGQDDLLQQQRIGFGTIEFFHHPACAADLTDFDEIGRFKRQDMMPHPRGRLFQGPREMRECGGGSHQQTQNIHAAGIRQQFDLIEGVDRGDCFHLWSKGKLNRESNC